MKAITYTKFGPPEVLQLVDVPKPIPKEHEVLIKIYAGTVTIEEPGWRASPGFNGFLKPRNPILGEEFAGEIESIGKAVTKFKVGDQVYGIDSFGAHAEYKCISEDKALVAKPSNLSYEEAAAIPNGALTALPFLRNKGNIQSGQKVLINGASGSVGTAAVQIAKYFGAEVTGVCSTPNIEMVQSLGADQVIDYTQNDFTKNGKTYDIIFDTVGKRSFSECKGSLTENGVYLTTVPTPAIMLKAIWPAKHGKKAGFVAAGLRSASQKIEDLLFINELIEAGKLIAVIDRRYPLEQLAEAHRYVATKRKKGNVVITAPHNHAI
ncbi:MAG TPA: NAD(P)-dependent alcohol dehydrogenase [Chloroflexi bacterium]|nr:NAD(P)-dependent alcohol dehydrogenase [Chloroflexota bacterium]